MATLNFPSDPSTQNPVNTYSPDSTPLASDNGVTYVWDGEKWTANSGGGNLDDVYVNVNGDTMTGDLTVPSLNGGPLAGMRNQLINGDFRVWQRGTTGLTDADAFYGADRWVSGANNTISRSGTAPVGFAYSARIQYSGAATEGYVGQPIELDNTNRQAPVRAGTYTLSWYSNDNTTNAIARWRVTGTSTTGQINAPNFTAPIEVDPADANGFARYSSQITIPQTSLIGGITSFYVAVRSSSNDFRVVGIQLEPGPVATPFEMRPIGTELALCQRYFISNFQCSPPPRTSGGNLYNDCAGRFTLPVAMRITPTALNVQSEQSDFTSVAVSGVTPSVINAAGTLGTGGISRLSVNLDAEL
jgi:hypothetical protein